MTALRTPEIQNCELVTYSITCIEKVATLKLEQINQLPNSNYENNNFKSVFWVFNINQDQQMETSSCTVGYGKCL